MLRQLARAIAVAAAFLASSAGLAADQPAGLSPASGGLGAGKDVLLLDMGEMWRFQEALSPPVIRTDAGLKPVVLPGTRWLSDDTPGAPAGWAKSDFDDGTWRRGHGNIDTPYLARLSARGTFTVTDPAKAGGLTATVSYFGGAVVRLNGVEIARGNLPAGELAPDALAEDYPLEAFVKPDGSPLAFPPWWATPTGEEARRLALRRRTLADVPLPRNLLHKGTNVLAIEVVRAPYHKAVTTLDPEAAQKRIPPELLNWSTCSLVSAQVSARAGDGVVASQPRPAGLHAWTTNPLASDYSLDFASDAPVQPIRIVGARGGSFSGKVIVGSAEPIRGIHAAAEPDASRSPGARPIPASWVRIRYASPGPAQDPFTSGLRFDALDPVAPAEVPLRQAQLNYRRPLTIRTPQPVAVVPVWVTVTVPREAAPGRYAMTLKVSEKGVAPISVPVELDVTEFTLPEPRDYRTVVDLFESPDTLAMEYGVEPWSAPHMALIQQSLATMAETGADVVYVPLISGTNLGNAQSMVRWIDRGGGKFDYDFTPMDRYLDAVAKTMVKPRFVCFWVWDCFLEGGRFAGDIVYEAKETQEDRTAYKGKGPEVTTLDVRTGKTGSRFLPEYSDPASRDLWAPVMEGIAKRMKARGWEGCATLGGATDAIPTDAVLARFKEFWPDAGWICYSHGGGAASLTKKIRVALHGDVWSSKFPPDPRDGRLQGWNKPDLDLHFPRDTTDTFPITVFRFMGEIDIAGEQRGVGRLGADVWEVVKDKKGNRRGRILELYPRSSWRNLNVKTAVLAPGAKGPVATARFEMLREGVEECEARIVIEKALLEKTIDGDLAARCRKLLDERTLAMLRGVNTLRLSGSWTDYASMSVCWYYSPSYAGDGWYVGSGWQERSRQLYAAAAEVQRKLTVSAR